MDWRRGATVGRSGRRVLAAVLLASVAVVLSACGGLAVTGPPEENEWPLTDHGRP